MDDGEESINSMIQNYDLLGLLEKEQLRTVFENKIEELSDLQNLGEDFLYPTYKEQIKACGPESWADLYKNKEHEEPIRDLFFRLKFKS
jgi:hypothetical protein